MGARERLLPMLEVFLSRESSVKQLWREFTSAYPAIPDQEFSDFDQAFYGAVNDKLIGTTFGAPSAQDLRDGLMGPDSFRAWLDTAVTEYKEGVFVDD